MPGMSKAWVFTLNNPTDEEVQALNTLATGIQYLCHQTEEGASGTTHLQGYVLFTTRKRLATVAKTRGFSRMHLEVRKGTEKQAIAYCSKPGGRDFLELGSASAGAEESGDLSGTKRAHFTIAIVHFGLSGSGKSHMVQDMYPDAYFKEPTHKWWDGYAAHDTVIVDDFQGGQASDGSWSREYFCRLIDKQPMQVETKGGMVQFVAKRVLFTSNVDPQQWYGGNDAIRRRITYEKEHESFYEHPEGTKPTDEDYEQRRAAYYLVNGSQ